MGEAGGRGKSELVDARDVVQWENSFLACPRPWVLWGLGGEYESIP